MIKNCFTVCSVIILSINMANAQSLALPSEGYTNTFGAAVSGGVFLDKDATFLGFSVDYSKVVMKRWIVNFSFAYDKEFSKKDNVESIVNTITPSLAIGHVLSPKIALGVGLGKGIFDDDNDNKKIRYNKDGGWTVGLIGVYSFYQKGHHSFDVSGGIERGLTNPETDLTIELGYGYSF